MIEAIAIALAAAPAGTGIAAADEPATFPRPLRVRRQPGTALSGPGALLVAIARPAADRLRASAWREGRP